MFYSKLMSVSFTVVSQFFPYLILWKLLVWYMRERVRSN